MTNLIKNIEVNKELDNAYISVILNSEVEILVQLEKETNRLHADFGSYSICIDDNACDENAECGNKAGILEELRERFASEVADFEEFGTEVEEYYNNI